MAKTDKPNILFVMADDIGWFNLSCYNHGLMGYRTPNLDRIAKEGAMFTDFYGQQSCTAGRAAFITGQSPIRTGLTKVGMPGADARPQGRGPDRRAVPQESRLRHRPVRQEPPRRPQRASADGARLRRVLRQSLSPQRRGRAGIPRLSEGPGFQEEVRSARRDEVQGDRQGRHDRRSGVRQGRQADDREHRPAHQEADGNGGRRVPRVGARLHGAQDQGGRTLVLLLQPDADARLHASEAVIRGRDRPRPLSGRHGRARRLCRAASQEARRPRRRRQHHRGLHHRQRRRSAVVAGRRRDAVPRREGHQLGRRLARALRHALARRHQARPGHQRHLLAAGFHPDLRGGGRRARPRREGEEGLQDRRHDLQGSPRRRRTFSPSSPARRRNRRARASSTGATTAT